MPIYTNTANDSNTYDALVIGAGPAGLTAAIYLKRANYKVAFIEKNIPGGKIVNTPIIENYPGVGKIQGADLALNMYQQAVDLGAQYIYGNVTGFKKEARYFCVFTEDGVTRFCKTLIIATGTTENTLNLPNEKELSGKGISHCAICDGSFAKGKDVAVIGSGSGALTNGLYLSSIANHVYMINRSEKYKDTQNNFDQLKKKANVEIHFNTQISELIGQGHLEAIKTINKLDNTTNEYKVSYLFIYVGSNASTEFINDESLIAHNGTITVDNHMQTSVPGLFAVGDVNKIAVRQITTATNDGTIAAINAINFLESWE